MNPVAKSLIGLGLILVILGVVWQVGGKFLPLGRLPGDISIEKENFKFYFPIGTSILLSLGLSLFLYLLRHFRK